MAFRGRRRRAVLPLVWTLIRIQCIACRQTNSKAIGLIESVHPLRAPARLALCVLTLFAAVPAAVAAKPASPPGVDAAKPASQASVPNREARYHACLSRAADDPGAAASEARAWIKEGGGDAAKHCAAAADLALGRPKDAAEAFELLAATGGPPQRQAALLAQAADAWVQAGSPDRAIAVLTEALGLLPGDAKLLIDRARAEVDLGRFGEAADDLTRAIDADSLNAEAYVLRASALRRAGRLDEAAFDVDTALMFDRHNPDALLERGLLRRAAGDTSGAREDWQMVMKIAPGSAAALMAAKHLDAGEGG